MKLSNFKISSHISSQWSLVFGESLKLERVWDHTVNMKCNVFIQRLQTFFYSCHVFTFFNVNFFLFSTFFLHLCSVVLWTGLSGVGLRTDARLLAERARRPTKVHSHCQSTRQVQTFPRAAYSPSSTSVLHYIMDF